MIVGTAGHIDHGKTTLIRALTGVDTDRLKEEKQRGISIELGYAYTPTPSGAILGFIDVPGHERLVRTMVAGASGIDFGLLVVAADDGVMPQTREHMAILSLLGIRRGAIAVTKSADVEPAQIEAVRGQIAQLTAQTFLQEAPVFLTNAVLPDCPGVAALRDHLHALAPDLFRVNTAKVFRLSVDRVFTLRGHGTVVTGTVHTGAVQVGRDDVDLRLMPVNRQIRVRSIHAQDRPSDIGVAGQRCALNLVGVSKEEIRRGDWIADARCFVPSRNIDVRMQILASSESMVRAWTPLHVHIGAAHYLAHAVPLSCSVLEPGQSGLVQLVFETPVCAMVGDAFIVRNAQANQTVGGGRILDPEAPDRRRRTPARLAWLAAMQAWLEGAGLDALLQQAPFGLDDVRLLRLTGSEADALSVPADAIWVGIDSNQGRRVLILRDAWRGMADRAVAVLRAFHQETPDEAGVEISRLRRMAQPAMPPSLWQVLCDELMGQGLVARNRALLHLPAHTPTLSPIETQLAENVLPLVRGGGFDPPWVRDIAAELAQPEELVRQVLRRLTRQGEVFQVVKDLFYHRDAVRQMAELILSLQMPDNIGTAAFRDAAGLGRKRAIQVLEFFDRMGFTRRVRDRRIVRADTSAWL